MIQEFIAERKIQEQKSRKTGKLLIVLTIVLSMAALWLGNGEPTIIFAIIPLAGMLLRGIFLIMGEYIDVESTLEMGDVVFKPDRENVFQEVHRNEMQYVITKFDQDSEKVLLKIPNSEVYRDVKLIELLTQYQKVN